jgi:nicotinamide phosphoribosyltransferase
MASKLARAHFGRPLLNYKGWDHIIDKHNGYLPLRIKAVPEGTPVPTGNVLMTVENTDPKCFWLTNAMESLLTHVWYPSTVASLSRTTKEIIDGYLERTSDSKEGLQFMLHDFGYRGASSHESAAIGGLGHLVNFVGTDTLPAMLLAMRDYDADLDTLAYSVPATEHSVMTARGREGEFEVVDQLLDEYPEGILSVVADSYDIYEFVKQIGSTFKERILARDGVFVVRPDSKTQLHPHPEDLVVWILEQLEADFGAEVNSKGFKVLNPKARVLWGDGIDQHGIEKILGRVALAGFSAENLVFGMGGGLLQKVNRDTQRFAFKASAIKRNGEWHDVQKQPLDASKASKKGRLSLVDNRDGTFLTIPYDPARDSGLVLVFENGKLLNEQTFDQVRANAAL